MKEAMKLALEALETLNSGDTYKTHNAATALRQAIEQAQKQEPLDTPLPCDVKVGHVTMRKGVALRTLVARMQVLYDMAQEQAQPSRSDIKQEPVAFVHGDDLDNLLDDRLASIQRTKSGHRKTALYTTPPQRKPLTDEEIMNIAKVSCIGISPHEDTLNFAKVIEAVHGIRSKT